VNNSNRRRGIAELRASVDRADLMHSLASFIDRHADEKLSLERLAAEAQLSPAYLQRSFKAVLGVSPKAYQDGARLRLLKNGLKAGKSVLTAIMDAGFQSTSRVYGQAARELGMSPTLYRRGGEGETICYASRSTSLGCLTMGATARGVCFAEFGADAAELLDRLRSEFPRAALIPSAQAASPELDAWIESFDAHIGRNAPRPELPLDLRGTAFQIRVWRFLVGVPDGATLSYSALAAGVGAPKAVRAAASACAANRIAVLVPCHRVLRGDQSLGGYRWGLERKRTLLAAERSRRVTG